MFTSRAEHRLLFNHGSAELRLAQHARRYGLVSPSRLARIEEKQARVVQWCGRLEAERSETGGGTWAEGVRRGRGGESLPAAFRGETAEVQAEVLYRVSYQGYLAREARQVEKLAHLEQARLPSDANYLEIRGLRKESAQKLAQVRPLTLAQASRISGVNPADISVLFIWLESRRNQA